MLTKSDKVFLLQLAMLLILGLRAATAINTIIVIAVYGGMIVLFIYNGKKE